MSLVIEYLIQPHHSGFDEWQCNCGDSEPVELDEIFQSIDGQIFELGVDELPEGVENILGLIHNEPERVFVVLKDDETTYFGIDSIEESSEEE
jgi:hypothetical protein